MSITEVEADNANKLQVYPNPAQTFVHVEHRISILQLIMIAIDGKEYRIELILDGEKASVDISHLPSRDILPMHQNERWCDLEKNCSHAVAVDTL